MNRLLTIYLLVAAAAFGQLTTTSTTLSSAVTSSSTAQWCLASATGVVLPSNATGQNGSYLLADREVAQVTGQGYTSTCFKVKRGQLGTGASVGHSAAATVWIGQPATSSGDPSRPFTGAFVSTIPTGSCAAADQYTLPVLYTGSAAQGATPGSAWGCIEGQWQTVGNVQITGLTGAASVITASGYGAGGVFRGQYANGTPTSPSGILAEQGMASFSGRAYGSTGYSATSKGSMAIVAAENWSDSAHGTKILFSTTPNGTDTLTQRWVFDHDGTLRPTTAGAVAIGTTVYPVAKASFTNCTSGASPAVCGASSVGAVAVAAAATTLVVNTTAVTAKSRIVLTMDSSLGSDLSVTCNTTNIAAWVSARTAGTSFTITTASGPIANPMCLSFHILN